MAAMSLSARVVFPLAALARAISPPESRVPMVEGAALLQAVAALSSMAPISSPEKSPAA